MSQGSSVQVPTVRSRFPRYASLDRILNEPARWLAASLFARIGTLFRLPGSNVPALFGLTILLPGVVLAVFGVRALVQERRFAGVAARAFRGMMIHREHRASGASEPDRGPTRLGAPQ